MGAWQADEDDEYGHALALELAAQEYLYESLSYTQGSDYYFADLEDCGGG